MSVFMVVFPPNYFMVISVLVLRSIPFIVRFITATNHDKRSREQHCFAIEILILNFLKNSILVPT